MKSGVPCRRASSETGMPPIDSSPADEGKYRSTKPGTWSILQPFPASQSWIIDFAAGGLRQFLQYFHRFGNHVARHFLATVSDQVVGVQDVSVARHDKGLDGLAQD